VREAAARLDAAATELTLRLRREIHVSLDGRPIDAAGEDGAGSTHRLTAKALLRMDGVGEIAVVPGGEALAARRDALTAAERALAELLATARAPTVDAAAEAATRARHHRDRATAAARERAVHAPEGLEALRARTARARERLATLTADRTGTDRQLLLGADGFFEAPSREAADAALRRAGQSQSLAAAALRTAAEDHEAVRAELEQARHALALLEGELPLARETVATIEERLRTARAEMSDGALEEAMGAAAARFESTRLAWVALREELGAAEPEAVAARLDGARKTLAQMEAARQALERSIHETRAWLEGAGQAGLGEERDELHASARELRALVERDAREARATALLRRVLGEAAAEAKRTFESPIRERVKRHVESLLPGAALVIDRDLRLDGLDRGGRVEPFTRLSHGTREQIAVLTRLAFAELLGEHGHAPPLLLDDALVYSDERRFARMKELLARAAATCQIVVFTCRERDWADVPAHFIRLSDCRV
jgi:chromosome segregation ATPase